MDPDVIVIVIVIVILNLKLSPVHIDEVWQAPGHLVGGGKAKSLKPRMKAPRFKVEQKIKRTMLKCQLALQAATFRHRHRSRASKSRGRKGRGRF